MKPPRYAIRAVSKLTGIPVETLRAWERRYRVVTPARDDRGRLYSRADVERLTLLRRAVDAGHAIGRVAPLSPGELRTLLAEPSDGARPSAPPELSVLTDAVDRFDAPAVRRELSRLAAALPPRALCREVALPFLRRVGAAWHEGRLSIAQEHMATAEVRSLLGALARLHQPREGAPRVVLAAPAGERHELGTLAASILAADAGLSPVYLGADVPPADVLSAASRVAATAVVLGWTGARANGTDPLSAVAEIARDLPRAIELWVGGDGAREAARATAGRAVALEDFDAFERALSRIR